MNNGDKKEANVPRSLKELETEIRLLGEKKLDIRERQI